MTDLDELVAEIYGGLGPAYARQANLARLNVEHAGADRHDGCTDTDALAGVLDSVPDDDRKSVKHSDTCWRTHAACLRDRIYSELGWE